MVEASNNERAKAKIIPPGGVGRKRHPFLGWLFVAVIGLSMATLLLVAVVPRSTQPEPTTIYVLHPAVNQLLTRVWYGCGALLIVAAIWCACIGWRGRATHALVLAFVGLPASFFLCLMMDPAPWYAGESVTATDQHVYSYVESSFLQGQTLAIGRDEGSDWLYHQYRLMGDTNGDSPRLWIPLVRPAGVSDDYGQIYCSESGFVVGLRYENQCYMAYDTRAGQFFGHPSTGEPGEAITSISPFILIGPDTEFHWPDVARILELATGEEASLINEAAVRQALDHPNPAVRELAKWILDLLAARQDKKAD